LAIDGGSTAVSGADATLAVFVPLSVVERKPLVLVCGPAVVALTLTLTVQKPLAGMLPPVGEPKVKDVAAAAGAHVGPPVQVVLADGVGATSRPEGSVSVNVAPVSCVVFVFVSVNVSVDTALTAMGLGAKAFVIVGLTAVPQPVKTTLSIERSAPGFVFPELNP
jgi:hypothetical protein